MGKKLGIVVSHPIQYYAPLFQYLAKSIDLTVFYCHNPTDEEIGREGFGIKFKWDVDLLSGYEHHFLKNQAKKPSLVKFNGCDNPDIGKVMKQQGITHVLIMGWYLKSYWQAFWYCIRHGIPVAVRGDSQKNPHENPMKTVLRKILYPVFIRQYTKLLFVGKRNKEYLQYHGARKKQLIFSPHAIDQSFWHKTDDKPEQQVLKFIWVGKFIPVKKPKDVVLAFKKAVEKNPNIELQMIGTGKLRNDCIEVAKNESRISFPGFKNQTELKEIYYQADCLILSSFQETWGLVVNEAFAMKTPAIVSSACGCAPDLIDEGKTGYTYTSGNTDQLIKQILKIADDHRNGYDFVTHIEAKNKIYSYRSNLKAIEQFITDTETKS